MRGLVVVRLLGKPLCLEILPIFWVVRTSERPLLKLLPEENWFEYNAFFAMFHLGKNFVSDGHFCDRFCLAQPKLENL